MKKWFFVGFILLMAFDTFAQICFKMTAINALPLTFDISWVLRVFSCLWVYGSILGYVGAFFTWMTLLKHLSIGASFAASHLEVVSVMVLSYWLFNEPITLIKITGAALILGGIVCLSFAEKRIARTQHDSTH